MTVPMDRLYPAQPWFCTSALGNVCRAVFVEDCSGPNGVDGLSHRGTLLEEHVEYLSLLVPEEEIRRAFDHVVDLRIPLLMVLPARAEGRDVAEVAHGATLPQPRCGFHFRRIRCQRLDNTANET